MYLVICRNKNVWHGSQVLRILFSAGLCRPSIRCTFMIVEKTWWQGSQLLKIPVHRRLSHGIRKCQLLWSFAEVVWTADKDVLYDPWEKKMMTSMSSLFLYGTVFVLVVFKPSERSIGRGCEDCVVVVPSGSQNVNSWNRRSDVLYDL